MAFLCLTDEEYDRERKALINSAKKYHLIVPRKMSITILERHTCLHI